KNYALIENLKLEFTNKLNIFTGETGAGKSITIEALGLLLGDRASAGVVRTGTPKSVITGVFSIEHSPEIKKILKEQDLELEENTIILRREIDAAGKSKCYCNDQPVTAQFASKIGDVLVDIHGQNEHQTLLKSNNQLSIIDKYGDLLELRSKITEQNRQYQGLQDEIDNLKLSAQQREHKIDLYKFQVKEIDAAQLKPNTEEEIDSILPQLKNSEKIIKLVSEAHEILSGEETSVISNVQKVSQLIESINTISEGAFAGDAKLEGIISQLKDASTELDKYRDKLEVDPKELDKLIEKKDLILKLKKKYGATAQEIIDYREKIGLELNKLLHGEENLAELEKKIKLIEKKLLELCEDLSQKRKKVCTKLEKLVEKEIQDLGMAKAKFKIGLEKDLTPENKPKITNSGFDTIEFLFSPNLGEEPRPLKEIASGGEMSRTMLALKVVLGKASDVPVMVFDEIDAGVSGPMSSVIGSKLEEISKSRQVFCVTHMAQIAGYAQTHYKVEKSARAGRTFTEVIVLGTKTARIEEMARMLSGGKITDTTRKHAEELLKK
ncbi:MAG: DNA repair protein RecN, partial [Elusimicrobia bacterium]|nr:DNA repair protein RecN [Elusimicrobiota bacterium]